MQFLTRSKSFYQSGSLVAPGLAAAAGARGCVFFSGPQRVFSGPTHLGGKSEPGMDEDSALELPGLRPPASAFFRDSKTMGDLGLPIKSWDQI
jgi:hypothetical protein